MSNPQNLPFRTMYTEYEESQKVNGRWPSGPADEVSQNTFGRFAGGNESSRQQAETTQKRFVSEVSYTSHTDKFRKTKFNQMETLKELRQEYEILRNLPLQDEFLGHSHLKKENLSEYSSSQHNHRANDTESLSSKQTDRRKQRNSSSNVRDTQILTLEKKQLELVIGNSMRKIEELLNNEIEYKKIIHELQIQLDSRSNDDKAESLAKTMKRNESQYNDRIESLKRDIERLKQINAQLQSKNDSLEVELTTRNQQLRKCRDEKRGLEDAIRLEKDKYMNLEIDIKRVRMENEIMEKDKNNEINRLKNLLENQPKEMPVNTNELRRLEQELRSSKFKYETLMGEFDKYRREVAERPREVIRETKSNNEDQQLKMMETLLNHLKEEAANQNRASVDLISSMVAKLDEKNERERERKREREEREREMEEQNSRRKISIKSEADENANRLLQELFHLRNEVSTLKIKEDPNRSAPIIDMAASMADYQSRIRKLEEEIADGSISKERLMKEYENMKSTYEYARDELDRVNSEYSKLKERLSHTEHHGQLSTEQLRMSFKEKEANYEDTIRQLRRQLDEALFLVDKAKKEGEFNVQLVRGEFESQIKLTREQIVKVEGEKELLRTELAKMKDYYESKIREKNALLEKTAQEYAVLCEGKEKTLVSYKANSEREMNELIRKIEGLAELNDRYLRQSTQLSNTERELNELRYLVRRMKGLNEGVDHLWQVKETEYYNVNELMKQLRTY